MWQFALCHNNDNEEKEIPYKEDDYDKLESKMISK